MNARPLTKAEWVAILEAEGFVVVSTTIDPIHGSWNAHGAITDDGGFFRTYSVCL